MCAIKTQSAELSVGGSCVGSARTARAVRRVREGTRGVMSGDHRGRGSCERRHPPFTLTEEGRWAHGRIPFRDAPTQRIACTPPAVLARPFMGGRARNEEFAWCSNHLIRLRVRLLRGPYLKYLSENREVSGSRVTGRVPARGQERILRTSIETRVAQLVLPSGRA